MAEEEVKKDAARGIATLYARKSAVASDKRQIKFYDELQDAIEDEDPRLEKKVYEVKMKLLGEIKLVLVPDTSETDHQAVKAVLVTGTPIDKPEVKKGKK